MSGWTRFTGQTAYLGGRRVSGPYEKTPKDAGEGFKLFPPVKTS